LGSTDAELSVTLVNDAEIAALAARYGRRPRATDVLSFPLAEGPGAGHAGRVLGDVVISLDTARRQARRRGIPLARELETLLVHGCLHVLGMDHMSRADRARMRALERNLRWELDRWTPLACGSLRAAPPLAGRARGRPRSRPRS
jgi:probable rRNA maturation factor